MKIIALLLTLFLVGCGSVRQQDLDAWVGVPVEALDTQSFFLTLPMIKTVTDSGVEIRVYPNKRAIGGCGSFGTVSYSAFQSFQTCSSQLVGCDNIFYIKNKKIIEYKPVGKCMTDERVRPESNYERFMK
ncbi:hypothetical protein [Polynucleobacter nymphae]|uniref:hypothetical protein n=1 Tax=Polynucleobacter nymphae TaxID=2081043 RepID=UPI001C0C30E3|nr:hypothetical protein [Polynucleobacter nymphae]MBU3607538.1 hypothetical protein [Polynucleobacter nymphae]